MAGDDLSGALLASSITAISLTTVFIGTRLWIRSSLKTIGTDDYLNTAACAFLTGLCICTILSAKFVFNMCTDLFLFIQPIPAMWRLHLPVAKRLGLIAMLSLDLLVCATSIIRINFVTRIGADATYEFADPMIWSQVELASLVICSTIPCLRQVIQKVPWLNHALGLSSGRRSSNNYYVWSGSKKTGGSIPLRSYNQNHKDGYLPSKSKGNTKYGLTSHAIGGAHTKNDRTEEIFPHNTDGNGAILVAHEMTQDVESHNSSAAPSITHVDDCEGDIESGPGYR
ncbi:uncharacterized protein FPRN_09020 [Fusarium proliferatum]|nr:uncharacterized protein FPRN_09020 [Fusarium proliferatum]